MDVTVFKQAVFDYDFFTLCVEMARLDGVCGDHVAIGPQFGKNICLEISIEVVRDVVTAYRGFIRNRK